MTATLFVRHTCADYDDWRARFDALADWQAERGVIARSVHRASGDGDEVLVTHQFASVADAEAFVASDEFAAIKERVGAAGPVRVEIFEDA